MSKRFLLILAALAVVFIGVVVYSKNKDSNSANNNSDSTSEGSDHILGANTGGVELVEFGDFQCPACRSYYPIVEQLKTKYGDQISFQFRHFPLVQIHQNAMVAHRAAEAAAKQGKFWEMYALLYQRQQAWESAGNPTAIMEDYAAELGINIDQFKTDFASGNINDIIQSDIRLGQQAGATSTPTFMINGKKIDNPSDVAGFSKLIDEQLSSAQQ